MTTSRRSEQAGGYAPASRVADRGDSGAVLVLALVFVVAVSLVVAGIVTWSGNDIKNAVNFKTARTELYAADGATQVAIWNIRYVFPASQTPGFCAGGTDPFTINGEAIDVWCNITSLSPASSKSRVVVLTAFLAGQCGSTSCTGNPFVRAQVTFDDISPTTLSNQCTSTTVQSSCGSSMSVDSWIVQPAQT
jgi:hypothetical protein